MTAALGSPILANSSELLTLHMLAELARGTATKQECSAGLCWALQGSAGLCSWQFRELRPESLREPRGWQRPGPARGEASASELPSFAQLLGRLCLPGGGMRRSVQGLG